MRFKTDFKCSSKSRVLIPAKTKINVFGRFENQEKWADSWWHTFPPAKQGRKYFLRVLKNLVVLTVVVFKKLVALQSTSGDHMQTLSKKGCWWLLLCTQINLIIYSSCIQFSFKICLSKKVTRNFLQTNKTRDALKFKYFTSKPLEIVFFALLLIMNIALVPTIDPMW